MGKHNEILSALAEHAKKHGPLQTVLAEVKDVDETTKTCTLTDDGIDIYEVRLRPVLDGNESITILPTVGTWALAIRIEDEDDWMVIHAGQIDKYIIVIGTCEFVITAGGFEISKGSDNLKDILKLMIEAVAAVVVFQGRNPDYIKLQTALSKLNNLMS